MSCSLSAVEMGNSKVLDVKKVIEVMEINLGEMLDVITKNIVSFSKLIKEHTILSQSYDEEFKKLEFNAQEEVKNISEHYESHMQQLEAEIRELELQGRELDLEIPQIRIEYQRRKHSKEIDRIILRSSYSAKKFEVNKRAAESMRKSAVDHEKQKENLDRRIFDLRKQLNALEAEVEQLKRTLKVMKLIEDDGDINTFRKTDDLHTFIKEKEIQYEYLEVLNHTLIVKERKSDDELQEAHKALLDAFSEIPNYDSDIGVKFLGDLDFKPFLVAVERKYTSEDEAFFMAREIHSLWEEYLRDPDWQPLKVINVDGQHKEIIDEDDEKLKNLKKDYGEDVYNAVTAALTELTEYNPIRRNVIVEVWNFKEEREATLGEGVVHLLKLWHDKIEEDLRIYLNLKITNLI